MWNKTRTGETKQLILTLLNTSHNILAFWYKQWSPAIFIESISILSNPCWIVLQLVSQSFCYTVISPELRERHQTQKNGGWGKGRRPKVINLDSRVPAANPTLGHLPLSYVSHLEQPCWHPSVLIMLGRDQIIARGKITLKTLPSWPKCLVLRAFIISFKSLWRWGRSHFHPYAKHSIVLMSESIQGWVFIQIFGSPFCARHPQTKDVWNWDHLEFSLFHKRKWDLRVPEMPKVTLRLHEELEVAYLSTIDKESNENWMLITVSFPHSKAYNRS